jgi:hypothetical protein
MNDQQQQPTPEKPSVKKSYRAPVLVQYGNIAKLTHNNPGATTGDAMAMMLTACL